MSVRRLAVMSLLVIMLCGCAVTAGRPGGPPLCHVVICTLKEPGNQDAIRAAVERSHTFREIPGVLFVEAGPMVPTDRPAVADDYDVGVMMMFEDEAAYEAYLDDPRHVAAVKEVLMPLSERVTIFDFEAARR